MVAHVGVCCETVVRCRAAVGRLGWLAAKAYNDAMNFLPSKSWMPIAPTERLMGLP
jgi:hypothetical protein